MKALSVRLPDGVHERLRREAFEQRVSMNDLVTEALGLRFDVWDRDDSGPWPVSRAASRAAEPACGIEYGTARRTAEGVIWDEWPLGDEPPTSELLATWRSEDDEDADEIVVIQRQKQTEWIVVEPACESASPHSKDLRVDDQARSSSERES